MSLVKGRGRRSLLAVMIGLFGVLGLLPLASASPTLGPVYAERQVNLATPRQRNLMASPLLGPVYAQRQGEESRDLKERGLKERGSFALWEGGGGSPFSGGSCDERCQSEARPPLEWPLILLQIFGGLITAAVSSYLIQTLMEVTIIGTQNTPERFQAAWVAYTVTNTTVIPWITAGVVYGLSRLSHNYETSFWWILLGAYCGQALSTIIGTIITAADPTSERRAARIVSLLMDGALNTLGAILFFVLFRRAYKEVQHAGSLLYYEGGRVHFTLPVPSVAWEAQGTLISVPLLRGHF